MPPHTIQNDLHAIDNCIALLHELPVFRMKVARIIRWIADAHPMLHEFSTLMFCKALNISLDLISESANDREPGKETEHLTAEPSGLRMHLHRWCRVNRAQRRGSFSNVDELGSDNSV